MKKSRKKKLSQEQPTYTYVFERAEVGWKVSVYNHKNKFLGSTVGFGKDDAKRQARKLLNLTKLDSDNEPKRIITKRIASKRIHQPKGSVMTGLDGKVNERPWNKTK